MVPFVEIGTGILAIAVAVIAGTSAYARIRRTRRLSKALQVALGNQISCSDLA